MEKFDAIIIGSGQAGTPLAFTLASKKWKIAFIEKEHYGGTCLNVGCTPTKTYVASARRMFEAKNAEDLGVHIPAGVHLDLKKVKDRKDQLIQKSVDGIRNGLENSEFVKTYYGEAKFAGHKIVEINGTQITAEKIYINVGGRPRMPKPYVDAGGMTSSDILKLTEIPKHLIIIGGSYIGLEFGQMFRRFGSEVTIVEMGDRIISREDEEVSTSVRNFLTDEGIKFREKATCLSAEKLENGNVGVFVECRNNGNPKIEGSHLLMAIGRIPNTNTLNLASSGILADKRGYIKVNDALETNVEGIYALGDCNGKGAFTHTAYNDFEIIAENMFQGKNRKVSDRILTYGLFVDPPLGRAGMTLAQAKASGKKIKYGHRAMSRIARAKEKGETYGHMSIVVDAETDKILGASVLGVGGDEIISSILNVMYTDQAYTVIRDSVQPHPTISELIPTMLESLTEIN